MHKPNWELANQILDLQHTVEKNSEPNLEKNLLKKIS